MVKGSREETLSGKLLSQQVLQLIQKNGWPIYGDIELEYKIPEGSAAVKETAICREYCKQALQ